MKCQRSWHSSSVPTIYILRVFSCSQFRATRATYRFISFRIKNDFFTIVTSLTNTKVHPGQFYWFHLILYMITRRSFRKVTKSLLAKLLYEFKIEEGISTTKDYFSPDIFINADKIMVNQVLDNLLTNAIKFTKEGIVSISITKWKKGENHN